MPDDDDSRPSLEAPRLFGRRRSPAEETPVFEDTATEPTVATPVAPPAAPPAAPPVVRRAAEPAAQLAGDATDTRVDTAPEPAPVPASPTRRRRAPQLDLGQRLRALRPTRPDGTDGTAAEPSEPLLTGRIAAVVAGLAAGLALVGFTWVGFRGCEAIRGSTSCGAAPGMLALALVLVLAVVVGGMLLSAFRVPDPGATSFLGTGLTGVISLLFLVDVLDHWSMVIVIPLVTAVTFLLSWWVTTTYVDTD